MVVIVALAIGCDGEPGRWAREEGNLLAGRTPGQSRAVIAAERLTDGVTVGEGSPWSSNATTRLPSADAFVEFDLGAAQSICCVALQADNNDRYRVEIAAERGTAFVPLWTAPAVGAPGIRTRYQDGLGGYGRWIRVRASGGDRAFSLAEIALFREPPDDWPPTLGRQDTPMARARAWIVLFSLTSCAFILVNRRGARRWIWSLALLPVGTGVAAAVAIGNVWPLQGNDEAYVRAALAAIAGVLLAREAFSPPRWALDRRFTTGALALICLLGVVTYFHFGAPQFRHAAEGRGTVIHTWDMRNYFPVAKYFQELRYDGLYLASVAAHLDNNPDRRARDVARVRLRDLTNNQMVYAGDIMPQIEAVHGRFSPERWESFRRDLAFFEEVMGTAAYLGSLQDHGGNATPVWVAVAHLLWRWAPASELILTLTSLIDPLLLLGLFFVIARTFGLRGMLIALMVFGTTDFSRFGSNLVGSTLRYDWIVALGLGVCALRTRRWFLGGILLAWAGLIRGFPAVAALFLAVPVAYWLVGRWRAGRFPGWRAIRREQTPALRALAGGGACVLFWLIVPSALFSYQGSWGAWLQKIEIHMDKPNVNHVGWRTLVGYDGDKTADKVMRRDLPEPWTDWQTTQMETLERRRPLFCLGVVLFVALAALAARGGRLDQAALLGMFLVPVLFYPANYYLHYIFLLPLIAVPAGEGDERLLAWLGVVICAASVAQYPTLLTPWTDICFTRQSVILLAEFGAMLVPVAWLAWGKPGGDRWHRLLGRIRPRSRDPHR